MINIDFQSHYHGANFVPECAEFTHWLNQTIAYLGLEDSFELVLRVVDDTEIRSLNGQYRDKDKVTNVLSFPFDNEHQLPLEFELLGDIVIASDVVCAEAAQQQKPLIAHWAHLTIHGLLHLLGYDHQTDAEAHEMEALEIAVMAKLGFENPYQ